MKLIFRNVKLEFQKYKPIEIEVEKLSNVYMDYTNINQVAVQTLNGFHIYYFINQNSESITVNVKGVGNIYLDAPATALIDTAPTIGSSFNVSQKDRAEKGKPFDETFTVPKNKYFVISTYAFADSTQPIPTVKINGKEIILP